MATLLQRIQEDLQKQGIQPRTADARAWLRSKVKDLNVSPRSLTRSERANYTDATIVGKMYFFFYDPKTKERMTYFDKFPLVIPVEEKRDGFIGLNLHYIHPKHRIALLDKMSEAASDSNYDENTKLKISYPYLVSAARLYESTPCVKRYLYSNIKSRFLEIKASDWDIAVMLPVESFVGASTSKVFSDSRKKF